jgi:hypothetical protein
MKSTLKETLKNAMGELQYGLRVLCGKPSPLKRIIAICILSCVLGIGYIHLIWRGVTGLSRYDAQQQYIEIQHIEPINGDTQASMDSINNIKKDLYGE